VAIEGLTAEAEFLGLGVVKEKSEELLFESVSPLSLRIRDRVLPEKADAAAPSYPLAVPYPNKSRNPAEGFATESAVVDKTSATFPFEAARLIEVLPAKSTGLGKALPTDPPLLKLTRKYDLA
jgi:hypothetical protein